jgi:hypothetical protein
MASLSPKVKEAIELETYRTTADSDGATDQYILNNVFLLLIKELEEIGLEFTVDYSDYTDELDKLFQFLQFVSYLLPNSLYGILKSDITFRKCVERILGGSLGADETLIQTYLSELGGLDGHEALVPELADTVDVFYPTAIQTSVFTDYMHTIYELVDTERMAVESDHETHTTYIGSIRDLVGRLSDAVNLFESDPEYAELCRIQNFIIKDFTSPTNFIDYNYLLNVAPESLPDELVAGYDRKWYHYRVSHAWCMPYHQVRDLHPSDAHYVMFFAFLYALHPTLAGYEKAGADILTIYPSNAAFNRIRHLYQDQD